MIYEEFDPSPGLAPWIANHWRFEVEADDPEHFEHIIVPDGTLTFSFMRFDNGPPSPFVFAGPSTSAHRVPVQRGIAYTGVRIHPAATGALLRLNAATLQGKLGMLSVVAPEAAKVLDSAAQLVSDDSAKARLALERGVQMLSEGAPLPDPAVVRAVDDLLANHGASPVGRLAAEAGLSTRQLRRRFLSNVGLSPKAFARLRRIRHACILMLQAEEAELAGLSQDGGYADQPHLTREFRGIFGSSPRLVETYLRRIEHVAVKD